MYRASPNLECCRDSWCCSCHLVAACCCPPFAVVGCLSKASLKTKVSWSQASNQCGSKLHILRLFMLPLDLKRLEFILRSWVRLHVVKIGSPVDLLKALKMASYHLPVICTKHYGYVLSFQVLFWSHGYERKWYTSYSF